MSTNEMLTAARAMRANKVKMPISLRQMSEHFLDVLQKAEVHATDDEATPIQGKERHESEDAVAATGTHGEPEVRAEVLISP